jgi:hypothetical protein
MKAIELVRSIREKQAEDIKGKSKKEIIEYFRDKANHLTNDLAKIVSASNKT